MEPSHQASEADISHTETFFHHYHRVLAYKSNQVDMQSLNFCSCWDIWFHWPIRGLDLEVDVGLPESK